MKNIFALMILFIVFCAVAQDFPEGPYAFQPNGKEQALIVWTNITLHVDLDQSGQIVRLKYFKNAEREIDMRSVVWSKGDTEPSFSDVNDWLRFTKSVIDRYKILPYDLYVEMITYKYIGLSIPEIRDFEWNSGRRYMIFQQSGEKNEGKFVSFPLEKWIGQMPNIGDHIYLGFSCNAEYYFRAVMVENECYMSNEMQELVISLVKKESEQKNEKK